MVQIAMAANEANAVIMRDFLESNGIHTSYAPNTGRYGHALSCTVYCIENKSEEAVKLLKEQGLIVY